jgi:L-asparaginase
LGSLKVKGEVMPKNKMFIWILTTGGTIEKIYDEFDGALHNRDTILKTKILQKLRLPNSDIHVKSLMSKDSLFMTDKDREFILNSIKYHEQEGHPIIVIHGTDTLEVTARYCFEHYPNVSVPVIFTGAMKPLGFDDSDAPQNVIEAIFAARILSSGYFATFHGNLFKVPNLTKNRQKGTFEEVE